MSLPQRNDQLHTTHIQGGIITWRSEGKRLFLTLYVATKHIVWRAVFTFNPYLEISLIHLEISLIHLDIYLIHLEIILSLIHLEISLIHLEISIIRSFRDNYNSVI